MTIIDDKLFIYIPNETKNIIFSYIPNIKKVFLNKTNYITNHTLIRKYINNKKIEEYIRKTIRQDHYFVFKQILYENIVKWIEMKNYYYRNCIYSNYLVFLLSYCNDYESFKCEKNILTMMEKLGLRENQYKKNNIRYIRNKTI
jgi:hypothetical protein